MKELLDAHRRLCAMLDFAERMESDLQREAPHLAPHMPFACIEWTNTITDSPRHIHEHIDSRLLRICADAVADQIRAQPDAELPLSMLRRAPPAPPPVAAVTTLATPAALQSGVRAWIKKIRRRS